MLMQKIRDNAAWVVVIAVVCFVALIFVDWGMSPTNQISQKAVVGSVAGDDLRFEEFDQIVQQKAKEATEQGQELNSEAYAQLRRQVFEEMVQERLFLKEVAKYNLAGTPEQVLDYLRRNPPPGAEKAPIFMGPDSQFSRALYEQWLGSPRVYDDRFMQMMEAQTTQRILPQLGLARILGAGQPSTDLEAEFSARRERSRAWGMLVVAPADSFIGAAPTDAELKKEFDAQVDSFFVGKPVASIPAAIFTKLPSQADTASAKDEADTVSARAHRGEDFAELAKQYSEDPGSAKNGGSLGGYQDTKRWVPQFAIAARALQPGQISMPIASPFGFHIIKCNGTRFQGADTLYDLSHVLVRVTTSPETIDSLKGLLDTLRNQVKAGKSFADAAKAVHANLDSVKATEGEVGASSHGLIPGASAWAFNPRDDEKTSEVLESSVQLAVLGKATVTKAGRHFEIAKDRIKTQLTTRAAAAKANEYLKSVLPKLQACDTTEACYQQIGKLATTKMIARPSESWVAGLGYAPYELLRIWPKAAKAPKTWVGPTQAIKGSIAVKIDSLVQPSAEELTAALAEQRRSSVRLGEKALQDFMQARRQDGKIKNNLDRFYRD